VGPTHKIVDGRDGRGDYRGMSEHPLAHIFVAAGGTSKLAADLGIHHSSPYSWRAVPTQHVRKVAKLTGIPLHQLRPDLYDAPRSRKVRAAQPAIKE